jgi:hypothetical protein
VDHRGDVVLDHLFVNRIPRFVAQWWRCPVAAARVWVQVDADVAVFFDALFQLGDASGRVNAWALRQHGGTDEVVGEKLCHAEAKLVTNRRPGRRHIEIANVMRHEAGSGAENRQIAATLAHEFELVQLDRFAQLVVADDQFRHFGHAGGVFDAGDLAVTPVFQRFWCGGVVAVGVDDERFLLAHGVYLVGFLKWNLNKF